MFKNQKLMTYDEFKKKFKFTRKLHWFGSFYSWWNWYGVETTKPLLKRLGDDGKIIYPNSPHKTDQYVIDHNGKPEAWYGSNI
jgi:hypothetical protein